MLCRNGLIDKEKLDVWSHLETPQPQQRIVLLGASNLARSFPVAVETAKSMFVGPLSIYAAKGFGRSYGKESSFFGKKRSGIFSCNLWKNIRADFSLPTIACVTDIGNDLAYEVPVETIVDWVCGCLDALQSISAKVVVCDLPTEVLRELSPSKYLLFRTLLFPQCGLSLSQILHRAEHLSERLKEVAKERKIPCFSVQSQWYGFDPIHPRKASYRELWRGLFALAGGALHPSKDYQLTRLQRTYLSQLRPESWTCFGVRRSAKQPNGRLQDGSSVALY